MPNRLLLSVAANSTNDILKPVFRFFRDNINIHARMDSSQMSFYSTTLELRDKKDEFKKLLQAILRAADISVKDIKLIEDERINESLKIPENIPDEIKKKIVEDFRFKPYLGHVVYDKNKVTKETEYFDLENEESTGTVKIYDLAGEIISALQNGHVLVIDEFNSGLHPLLNTFLVKLFIDPNIKKKVLSCLSQLMIPLF